MEVALKQKALPDPQKGPFSYTWRSFCSALGGIFMLLRKPWLLLPTIIIILSQILLSNLPVNELSQLTGMASFFTFARGGVYAGFLGAVGGILGKGLYAAFINSLLMPLLTGKHHIKPSEKKGTASPISSGKVSGGFRLVLMGIALGLIFYNFFTGNASLENSIIGVTSFIACFRAAKNKNGFALGFLSSLSHGRTDIRSHARLVFGCGIGFLLGVASSFLIHGGYCYLLGVALLVLSLIFSLFGRKNSRRIGAQVACFLLIFSFLIPFAAWEASAETDTDTWMLQEVKIIPFVPDENIPIFVDSHSALDVIQGTGEARFTDAIVALENGKITKQFLYLPGSLQQSEDHLVNYIWSSLPEAIPARTLSSLEIPLSASCSKDGLRETAPFGVGLFLTSSLPDYESLFYREEEPEDLLSYQEFPLKETGEKEDIPLNQTFHFIFDQSKDFPATHSDGEILSIIMGGATYGNGGYVVYVYEYSSSPASSSVAVTGAWKQIDRKIYYYFNIDGLCQRKDSNGSYNDDFGHSFSVDDNDVFRYSYTPEPQETMSFTFAFSAPPPLLQGGDLLRLKILQYDTQLNGNSQMPSLLSEICFLMEESPPLTCEQLNGLNLFQGDSPKKVLLYFGESPEKDAQYRLAEPIPFAEQFASGKVPQGDVEGQRMSLNIINQAFTIGPVFISYLYEWDAKVTTTPAKNENSSEEGSSPFSGLDDLGLDNPLGPDLDFADWDEPISSEDKPFMDAAAAASAILGAAGTLAGLFSGGGGRRGGIPVEIPDGDGVFTDKAGDLVTKNPITGDQQVFVRQEDGTYRDPLTDVSYTKEDLQERNRRFDRNPEYTQGLRQSHQESQSWQEQARKDNSKPSAAGDEIQRFNQMSNLQNKLQAKGKTGDSIADSLSKKLNGLLDQQRKFGSMNASDKEKFQKAYGKYLRGDICSSRAPSPPAPEYGGYTWNEIKNGFKNTLGEVAESKSGKSVALRVGVGILTGGASEAVYIPSQSLTTMKEYVDKGGNSTWEGFSIAAKEALVNEAIGRGVGLGFKAAGAIAGKAAGLASKTAVGKAVADKLSWVNSQLNKDVKDVAREIKDSLTGSKNALSKGAPAAEKPLSGLASSKTPGSSAKNAADDIKTANPGSLKNPAGDLKTSKSNASKKAAPGNSTQDSSGYKSAEEKFNLQMQKANANAQKRIAQSQENLQKDPTLSLRDKAFQEGVSKGTDKVKAFEKARQKLSQNPDSKAAQEELNEALKAVQGDKHAMNAINQSAFSDDTRMAFNKMKIEKDTMITQNTKNALAKNMGVPPEDISLYQATNNSSGISGTKVSYDLDQTYRVKIAQKNGSVIYKDIPAKEVDAVQHTEVYKEWHNGKSPANAEEAAVFAKKMDYANVDGRSAEAYGSNTNDACQAFKKDGTPKSYGDSATISKTVEHKSTEWMNQAKEAELAGDLAAAEGFKGEAIRQATKQYDNLVAYQIKAINAIPGQKPVALQDSLVEAMEVLKSVGSGPGKISPAAAENILQSMGTNTEKIIQASATLVETLGKLAKT